MRTNLPPPPIFTVLTLPYPISITLEVMVTPELATDFLVRRWERLPSLFVQDANHEPSLKAISQLYYMADVTGIL
jgi:hypothetical protein